MHDSITQSLKRLDFNLDLYKDILGSDNIAEVLAVDQLKQLSGQVAMDFDMDEKSRQPWLEQNKEYMQLAMQISRNKSFPYEGAANIKYPMLTVAALQFHARAYAALSPSGGPVKIKTVGNDLDYTKHNRANRVQSFMNYQVMEEIVEWDENFDRMLLALPIAGEMYRKKFYDAQKDRVVDKVLFPQHIVVNYHTKSMEDVTRLSEIKFLSSNDLMTRVRTGVYLDTVGISMPVSESNESAVDELMDIVPYSDDRNAPHKIIETHTWLDLDGDSFEEPYVIEWHFDTQNILSIRPLFEDEDIKYNEKGEIIGIKPMEVYIKYPFIPNPSGGFYCVGFGVLLGTINKTVNSTMNQLLDAGRLNNSLGGMISKRLSSKLPGNVFKFKPWQFVEVASTVEDISKHIWHFPPVQPSPVSMNLLGTMLDAGREISSITDLMMGNSPGQNQPLGTTEMVAQSSMQLFSTIYKRIYRQMTREFKQLYKLNQFHLDNEKYARVLDDKELLDGMTDVTKDFDKDDLDILPSADPNVESKMIAMSKARDIFQLASQGQANMQIAVRILAEASGFDEVYDLDQLLEPPPPPADPAGDVAVKELEHKIALDWAELELRATEIQYQAWRDKAAAIKSLVQAQQIQDKQDMDEVMAQLKSIMDQEDMMRKRAGQLADYAQRFGRESAEGSLGSNEEEGS